MINDRSKNIERYLGNEMSPEEKKAFDAELSQNSALREELGLWQDMDISLRPDEEDNLRDNLRKIAEKHDTPDTNPTSLQGINWRWLLMLIGLILLLWLGVKLIPVNETNTIPDASDTEQSELKEPNSEDRSNELTPVEAPSEKPSPEIEEKTKPNTVTPSTSPQQKEPDRSVPIAAADFTPNPQLESLIGQQLRSNAYTFKLSKPSINGSSKQVSIAGTLETEDLIEDLPPFQLLLFTNEVEAYQNYQPLYQEKLNFQPLQDTLFSFNLNSQESLESGLYYYLIEDENSGMIYFVEKVTVE